MDGLQMAMDNIGGTLQNIGYALDSRNAWLIVTFVLFIPLALWGYAMFCSNNQAFFPVRVMAVAVVSFGISFGASKLILTAVGVVFVILSGIVYMIGQWVYLMALLIVLLIRIIMEAFAPK